ncbi:hypothetical protein BC628DRAFT_399415 [Trametes gibbosa]|nr:hypothetical protein BC628DRAFT_399415 [Trametes gibbosa]
MQHSRLALRCLVTLRRVEVASHCPYTSAHPYTTSSAKVLQRLSQATHAGGTRASRSPLWSLALRPRHVLQLLARRVTSHSACTLPSCGATASVLSDRHPICIPVATERRLTFATKPKYHRRRGVEKSQRAGKMRQCCQLRSGHAVTARRLRPAWKRTADEHRSSVAPERREKKCPQVLHGPTHEDLGRDFAAPFVDWIAPVGGDVLMG